MPSIDHTDEELQASAEEAACKLLDADDQRLLARLPEEKRAAALHRIAVLAAWRDPSTRKRLFDGAVDAAGRLGLARSGFYALVQNNDPPRLVTLGLNLGEGEDVPAVVTRSMIADEATAVLRAEPGLGTSDLVRRLQAGAGAGMSDSTLVRIVDEVRRRAPARAPFGTELALDAASMDLIDGAGTRQRLYVACDLGTGLVLGWRVAEDDSYDVGYGALAADVLSPETRSIGPDDIEGLQAAGGPLAVEAAFGSPASFALQRRMADAGWRLVLDPRRVGRRSLSTLGRRIGGIGISAGTAPPGVFHANRVNTKRLPLLDDGVLARIGGDVARHNRTRLELARQGDGAGAWTLIEDAMRVVAG